jgi:hypothetical protein
MTELFSQLVICVVKSVVRYEGAKLHQVCDLYHGTWVDRADVQLM